MTTTKKLSIQEKITALRATFLEQLPERIERAQALFARLLEDPYDPFDAITDLHRLFHSLKGTGKSFGFLKLGQAVEQAEKWTNTHLSRPTFPLSTEWLEKMEEYIYHVASQAKEINLQSGQEELLFTLTPSTAIDSAQKENRLLYICDDEILTVEKLTSQLKCFGFKTKNFTDTTTLEIAVLSDPPHAVIMDIIFPHGQNAGTNVMKSLRQTMSQNVPVIFLSSRQDFAARLAAVQAGGMAYFQKPVTIMELVTAIDNLTDQQQPDPFRILIIDDETDISAYHSLILESAGMTTRQCNDPSTTLEMLQEFRADIVLMDIYMPSCNGSELATLIRQVPNYIGLPIIYLSAETDRKKQNSAMRIGAEGFLTKPVIPDELVAAVTIRAERMRTLRSLMTRDSLTGLFNHTTITQLLESTIALTKRCEGILCFAMIDIDHFKLVNDNHGHPVGDQVILALSRILLQRLRNSDVVGRYGGEEFAVILQDITMDRAFKLLDQLRSDFSQVVFHSQKGDFSCNFSAGIACFKPHDTMESLRETADKALYEAKRAGRNRICATI